MIDGVDATNIIALEKYAIRESDRQIEETSIPFRGRIFSVEMMQVESWFSLTCDNSLLFSSSKCASPSPRSKESPLKSNASPSITKELPQILFILDCAASSSSCCCARRACFVLVDKKTKLYKDMKTGYVITGVTSITQTSSRHHICTCNDIVQMCLKSFSWIPR